MVNHDPAKPARASITEMTEIVLPSDGNALGTAFGGRVMQWIDVCAAVAAMRHCRKVVVTASMDELHFHAPIRVGDVAHLRSRVNAAFRHSLEVGVEVYSENPVTGERGHTCSALLTFAALDADGKPTTVPPLALETQQERDLQVAAAARREQRLANRRRSAPND
ncbi:MAG TPA: acyl-CoA thioesterase [Vulgatibacter sp.]|nr:acyl-CoA thioesterase [Vulgatibacter sp.]